MRPDTHGPPAFAPPAAIAPENTLAAFFPQAHLLLTYFMATQEFYIRSASETEARGPFTQEHLLSLSENGQITKETLFYDANSEQWVRIGDNTELTELIFPERKALKLKTR